MKPQIEISPEQLGSFFRALRAEDKACLHPTGCDSKVTSRAHSISRSKSLGLIAEDGHIIAPEIVFGVDDTYGIHIKSPFRSVSWKKATTFAGMCQPHDSEMFARLDNQTPDWDDPEYLFLTSYRGILKEINLHRSANALFDAQGVNMAEHPATFITNFQSERSYDYKAYWDQIILFDTPDWDEIEHEVFILSDMTPSVAATQLVSLDDIAPLLSPSMVLSIIPEENRTIILFSCTKEEAPFVRKYLQQHLPEPTHPSFPMLLSRLLLQHCGNIAIAPSFWRSLPKERQILIEDYFMHTHLANNHNFPAEGLNLFHK